MGTTSMGQFLRSLCRDSPWNYAVFWKLYCQDQGFLTWEDGYVDLPGPEGPLRGITGGSYLSIIRETSPSLVCNGALGDYSVERAVTEMSTTCPAVGIGAIGEAAFSGKSCWIFSENMFVSGLNPDFPYKCLGEWLLQFVAGIKTILLIPLLPHGVLQLGSLQAVAEDEKLVAHIKDKFAVNFTLSWSGRESLAQSSGLMAHVVEHLEEPSVVTTDIVNEDLIISDTVDVEDQTSLTKYQIMSSRMAQDSCIISREIIPDTLANTGDINLHAQSVGTVGLGDPLHRRIESEDNSDIVKCKRLKSSSLEEVKAFAYSNKCKVEPCGDYTNDTMDFHFPGHLVEPMILSKDSNDTVQDSASVSLSYQRACELHDALGPFLFNQSSQDLMGSMNGGNLVYGIESTSLDAWPCFNEEACGENLLEAVVANAYSITCDKPKSSRSLITATGQNVQSHKSGQCHSSGEDTVSQSCVTSEFVSKSTSTNVSHVDNLIKNTLNALAGDKHKTNQHYRNGSKISTTNKRKARGGDSMRPRPRDRQLIQDRLKELRHLVPNGDKCSIDSLLDKTIKHMLFLRNVTGQAEKLKQEVLEEVTDGRSTGHPEAKDGYQKGTSWVVELGSNQHICPIVVKDLKLPGQMLIEMMCNNHGRFLEIADVIHRLELTILKGVMEPRSDTMWAYFIVEAQASGTYHRLDIFWPLMQLLQQN